MIELYKHLIEIENFRRKSLPFSWQSGLALIALLTLMLSNAVAQIAPVNPPFNGMHIDGGLKANTPFVNVGDWVKGSFGSGGVVFDDNGLTQVGNDAKLVRDAYDSSTEDIIFTEGSKFNSNPNDWKWSVQKAPGKNDIHNALYLISKDESNDWLIIGGDRLVTTGTSYIDFELLQKPLTRNTADNGFTSLGEHGGRTVNDMVVSMEYSNGGTQPKVVIYQWKEVVPGTYDYVNIPLSTIVPGTGQPLSSFIFAETNRFKSEDVPFGAFGSNLYQQFAFVEAAINMTAVFGALGDRCLGLSIKTVFVKTKASDSQTAALKDLVEPIEVNLNFGSANIAYEGPFCPEGTAAVTFGEGSVRGGTFSAMPEGMSINPETGSIDLGASTPGTYTVTYTYTTNGCVKSTSDEVIIKARPDAPVVTVLNNCDGTSTLTASDYTGTLLWSNGATTPSIMVSSAETYSVVQTVNGCTSAPGFGTAAPKTPLQAPLVSVVDNCDGTSTLSASNYTGVLKWSTGETSATILVHAAGEYTVTQTVDGCTSAPGSGIAAPKNAPVAPEVSVVDNCDGTSILTASNYTGTLSWSNGASTSSIVVSTAGEYSVTQTINGCTSAKGVATAAPKHVPDAPGVTVADNCDGTSTLSASNYTGALKWSTGETSATILVHAAGEYTVTQTVDGCTSAPGSGIAAPKNAPVSPEVSVVDNCDGTSILTASNYTGTLSWSNGASTSSIVVSTAGEYTVKQTVNGCASPAGAGIAAPKSAPAAPVLSITQPTCVVPTGQITISSATAGLQFSLNGGSYDAYPAGGYTFLVPGTYTLTAKNSDGCVSALAYAVLDEASNCSTVAEGCTPGYWKNRKDSWNAVTYKNELGQLVTYSVRSCVLSAAGLMDNQSLAPELKNVLFRTLFGLTEAQVEARLGKANKDVTLLQSLKLADGSGFTQLARAGVAALLNSCSMNYAPGSGITSSNIVANIRSIFVNGDRSAALSLAQIYDEHNNNSICVLNNSKSSGTSDFDRVKLGEKPGKPQSSKTEVFAYPNPFKDKVQFEITVKESAKVRLELFDLNGRRVATLFEGNVAAGEIKQIEFRAGNLNSGMYFYRLISDDKVDNFGKLLLN